MGGVGTGTHHVVGTYEVLEGQGSSESGIGGERVGIDNVQQGERVLGLGGLLLQSILGCRCVLFISTGERGNSKAKRKKVRTEESAVPLRCWEGSRVAFSS